MPETAEPGSHRLDILGTVLIGGALFAIVDAIIEAPGRGWTATATLAETAAGLAALAVFAWWELRIAHPLVDLRIFASRAFSTAAASVTVIFFALFGSLFVLTQYLQLVHGYSPLSAGLRALPFALAIGAMSPLSPILASRFGTRLVIPAGMALMGLGLLDLSTAGVHTAYPPIALAVAIMGAGMGLVMAPASTTIMTTVPAHQAGAGSAINDTIREVGGALGIAIVGSLAAAVYRSRLTHVLTAQHAPSLVVHLATSSVAAADAAGQQAGGAPGSELVAAAHSAFVNAMAMGVRVAAASPAQLTHLLTARHAPGLIVHAATSSVAAADAAGQQPAARRAATWWPPRTAPSSPPWPWEYASPPRRPGRRRRRDLRAPPPPPAAGHPNRPGHPGHQAGHHHAPPGRLTAPSRMSLTQGAGSGAAGSCS